MKRGLKPEDLPTTRRIESKRDPLRWWGSLAWACAAWRRAGFSTARRWRIRRRWLSGLAIWPGVVLVEVVAAALEDAGYAAPSM